ncbi:hypothetical protein L1987_52938 [Smallanthus sonchifolius]|uniref:Uncharacterized protein n=1 Tax=Smallanthus sonchifolius TaxID=185202 RepID=A0ACB9EV55_9ASTR|nr:hypothetical protein L1987_52938 [Smallanthus sonchifolius]
MMRRLSDSPILHILDSNDTEFQASADTPMSEKAPSNDDVIIVNDEEEKTLPSSDDWDKVESVCSFLSLFNEATKIISGSEAARLGRRSAAMVATARGGVVVTRGRASRGVGG